MPRRPHFHPHTSPITKLLSTLSLLLPPILLLISFALTLHITQTADFARADRLSFDPDTGDSIILAGKIQHRSPFFTCSAEVGKPDDPDFFAESCTKRTALGAAGLAECRKGLILSDTTRICEKVTASAELYVAGAVLLGFSFLALAMHAIGTSLLLGIGPGSEGTRLAIGHQTSPRGSSAANFHGKPEGSTSAALEDGEDEPATSHGAGAEGRRGFRPTATALNGFVGHLGVLMAVMGAGCVLLGQIQGVAALVIEASDPINQELRRLSRWYLGNAAGSLSGGAYALGFAGMIIAVGGCGVR